MKRVISLILILCLLLTFSACSSSKGTVVIKSADDTVLATAHADGTIEYENDIYFAYVGHVLDELKDVLGTEKIYKNYTVTTYFDYVALDACVAANKSHLLADTTPFAIAITNTDGQLLCAFSTGGDDNFATKRTQAHSAIKPLSVYAPAIESGLINWSTMVLDSPVSKVTEADGTVRDWPANGNNYYANEKLTIVEAIKQSLNTVAVRVLSDYGVSKSIDFLESNFDIDLSQEKEIVEKNGEDQALAALGLGYLVGGVSPIDMSGYYEIFATGGKYLKPYAIDSVKSSNGKEVYKASYTEKDFKQVISEETAYVMNKMLQQTKMPGGTLEKAVCATDVEFGGKTGTGTDYDGNWAVSFTPEYICSIWHARDYTSGNKCASILPYVIDNLDIDTDKHFKVCEKVIACPYCIESGDYYKSGCLEYEIGYYLPDHIPNYCNIKTGEENK